MRIEGLDFCAQVCIPESNAAILTTSENITCSALGVARDVDGAFVAAQRDVQRARQRASRGSHDSQSQAWFRSTMPSKHRLSPAPLPPPKRLHTAGGFHASTLSSMTFESAFYDELLLCVFSHLSWVDLCATQATSRSWARLAADNELWKGIYLRTFGRPRLRGARGFIGRADGREVRSLPGRARHEDYKDWKWMFRISWNWRTGMLLDLPQTFPIYNVQRPLFCRA